MEASCVKTCVLFQQKWCDRPFRVGESDLTITVFDACAQKRAGVEARRRPHTIHPLRRQTARTPTDKSVWGITNMEINTCSRATGPGWTLGTTRHLKWLQIAAKGGAGPRSGKETRFWPKGPTGPKGRVDVPRRRSGVPRPDIFWAKVFWGSSRKGAEAKGVEIDPCLSHRRWGMLPPLLKYQS